MCTQGISLLAILVYLPTSGKDVENLDCLAELSIFIYDNYSDDEAVLIGTDSNCSEKSSARRFQAFQLFCEQHDMVKFRHPEATFHHSNGTSSSNIDFFLLSRKHAHKLSNIVSQCNQEHPENFSCHDPIFATMQVSCPSPLQDSKVEKYSHTYSEFKHSRVIWNESNLDEYQSTAAGVLLKYEALFPTSEFIPLKCQLYSELLVKSAEICLDSKPAPTSRKFKSSPKVQQAWQHLQKSIRTWKKEGKVKDLKSTSFLQYKKARANFQQTRRYQHNLKTIRVNNELMNSFVSDRNKHFKLVKNIRGTQPKKVLKTLHTPVGEFFGNDTLEGFASDAEYLARLVGENPEYDNAFYRLCVQDNQYIFDFKTPN